MIKITLSILFLMIFSTQAFAYQEQLLTPNSLINNLIEDFLADIKEVAKPIQNAANNLFWLLMPISLVVTGIKQIFADGNLQSFFLTLSKFVLIVGIYYFLLDNGQEIGSSIIDSFLKIIDLDTKGPSELLDYCFNISASLNARISEHVFSPLTAFFIRILILINTLLLFFTVLNFAITYVKANLLCFIGVYVLGFGSFAPTRGYATNYIVKLIAISLELLTLVVLTKGACKVMDRISSSIENYQNLNVSIGQNACLTLIFSSLFIYMLCASLPKVVSSLISFDTNYLDNHLKVNLFNKLTRLIK